MTGFLGGDISARLGPDVTVIDDFEDGDLSGWDAPDYSATNESLLEGSWVMRCTSSHSTAKYDTADTTTRGNKYRCRLYDDSDAAGQVWFFVGNPVSDSFTSASYAMRVRTSDDDISLYQWPDGNSLTGNHSVTLNTKTEYWPEIEYAPTGSAMTIRIYDSAGTELQSATADVDDTHTGGTIGVDSRFNGLGVYDYFVEEPI